MDGDSRSESEGRVELDPTSLRRLVERLPIALLLIRDGRVVEANPRAVALLGATPTGREPAELLRAPRASTREPAEDAWQQVLLLPSGETAPVMVHRLDLGDGLFGLVLFDRREFDRLERQFLRAQRFEAAARLASGVAHDLGNVLTVIDGSAEELTEDLDDQDARRQPLDEIRSASDRAAALVRKLGQVAGPGPPTARRPADLNDLVVEAATAVRRVLGPDVALACALYSGELPVQVDAGQLEQVLANLAINARDALPSGGQLMIETGIQGDAEVCLTVRDTGCGMDETTRLQAVEPFFTTKPAGTGLGLAAVQAIVRQWRGELAIESACGRGTVVSLTLPRAAEGDAVVAVHGSTRGARRAAGSGATLLVAEDDPSVRAVTCAVLRRRGHEVLEASSGAEAIERLTGHAGRVALLISDVVMPGMDGIELASRVAEVSPETRVLLVSAYGSKAETASRACEGQASFLRKPYTPETLARTVQRLLDSSGPEQETRTVLVIDDEPLVRRLTCRMLSQAGYRTLDAEDGAQGMRQVRRHAVDLVITDLVMPNKEGIETCRELAEEFPELPVIATSGAAAAGTYLGLAGQMGAIETLAKPVRRKALLEAVERALATRADTRREPVPS